MGVEMLTIWLAAFLGFARWATAFGKSFHASATSKRGAEHAFFSA